MILRPDSPSQRSTVCLFAMTQTDPPQMAPSSLLPLFGFSLLLDSSFLLEREKEVKIKNQMELKKMTSKREKEQEDQSLRIRENIVWRCNQGRNR